jgi:hypothetical protein
MWWWLIPLTVGILLSFTIVCFVAKRFKFTYASPVETTPLWDLRQVASGQINVIGPLAGFSIAVVAILAGVLPQSQKGDFAGSNGPLFTALVAMFLIGFMLFVSASIMYVTIPKDDDRLPQRTLFTTASIQYYLAVFLTWIALVPLRSNH